MAPKVDDRLKLKNAVYQEVGLQIALFLADYERNLRGEALREARQLLLEAKEAAKAARLRWDRSEEMRRESMYSDEVLRAAGMSDSDRVADKSAEKESGLDLVLVPRGTPLAETKRVELGEEEKERVESGEEEKEEEKEEAEFERHGALTREMLRERKSRRKMGSSFDWAEGGKAAAERQLKEVLRLEQLASRPLDQLADELAEEKRGMDRGIAQYLLDHAIEMVTRPFRGEKQTVRQREQAGVTAHLQRLTAAQQLKKDEQEAKVPAQLKTQLFRAFLRLFSFAV